MVSTGFNGRPILILGLESVKTLKDMLVSPKNDDQNRIMEKIVNFLNDPACLELEKQDRE